MNQLNPAAANALDRDAECVDLGIHTAHGSNFAVQASEPLAHELASCLADLRSPSGHRGASHVLTVRRVRNEWSVTWNREPRYRGPDPDVALYDALIAINEHGARSAVLAGHTVLHGGAVEVDGSAVVLVGQGGAGKSTFTTAMTRSGHGYLADEVVAVRASRPADVDGSEFTEPVVDPFHRPIGLRRGGAATLGLVIPDGPYGMVHPYRVGGRGHLRGPTPLRLIVLLQRGDFDQATIEPVSPASALFTLANQTLGGAGLEREIFRRLDDLVRTVAVAEIRYRDVGDAMAVVEQTVTGVQTRGAGE